MKYIVAGGCSFTRQEKRLNLEGTDSDYLSDFLEMWRWPHWIQKLYDVKLYNMGSATNDNWTIARSIIYKVEKLLNEGISTNDVKVIIPVISHRILHDEKMEHNEENIAKLNKILLKKVRKGNDEILDEMWELAGNSLMKNAINIITFYTK